MAGKCNVCGFPLDPWGECIRCVPKSAQVMEQKHCEKMRVIARRELSARPAEQVAQELSHRFPELSLDVVKKLEVGVRRRKRVNPVCPTDS